MDFVIHFGRAGEPVTAVVTGTTDLTEQKRLYTEIANDPRYTVGAPILVDYSGIDERRAPTHEVESLGRFMARLEGKLGDAKLAIVVPDTISFGLGRQSSAWIDTPLRMSLFFDRSEALAWLLET
jgi:hypothetical protein